MMKITVEKSDDDREKMMMLISAMKADSLITSDQFMEVTTGPHRIVFIGQKSTLVHNDIFPYCKISL
jgi:hypothetical protein